MELKAGYRLPEWLRHVPISRSKFYNLPPELRPHSVNLAGVMVITEQPPEYLARITAAQQKA